METFKRRLAETMVWCAHHASAADPEHSLRTPSLQPRVYYWSERKNGKKLTEPERLEHVGLEVGTVEERHRAVDELANQRAHLLPSMGRFSTNTPFSLGDGRLLFYSPELNHLYSGWPMVASAEFFDQENSPPWDTWVYYVSGDTYYAKHKEYYSHGWEDYLICWIPGTLLKFAAAGVLADAEIDRCIRWGDEVDTNFSRQLRALQVCG